MTIQRSAQVKVDKPNQIFSTRQDQTGKHMFSGRICIDTFLSEMISISGNKTNQIFWKTPRFVDLYNNKITG